MWDAPRMAADKVFQQCLSSAFPSTKEHSEFLLKVPFFYIYVPVNIHRKVTTHLTCF